MRRFRRIVCSGCDRLPLPGRSYCAACQEKNDQRYAARTIPWELDTQGKCEPCGIHYYWPQGEVLLRDAYCPKCQGKLERTLYKGELNNGRVLQRVDTPASFRKRS